MEPLTIRPVTGPQDWQAFAEIKEKIHFPLTGEKSDGLQEIRSLQPTRRSASSGRYSGFVAWRGNTAAGRIMAIDDSRHQKQDEGFFGFFECLPDQEAAAALIKSAAGALRGWNKKTMVGPISPSTNAKVGIMTAGFATPPHPYLAYNPAYYQRLLEASGLKKVMGLLSYLWQDDLTLPEKYAALAQKTVAKHRVTVHYPARGNLRRETLILQNLYNESLQKNWGFIPLTFGETKDIIADYRFSPRPEFLFRLDVGGEPAGLCLMQLHTGSPAPSHRPAARVAVVGLKPRFQKQGLSTLLVVQAMELLQKAGYTKAEVSLIMENNHTVRGLLEKTLGYPVLHRYQVYGMDLKNE